MLPYIADKFHSYHLGTIFFFKWQQIPYFLFYVNMNRGCVDFDGGKREERSHLWLMYSVTIQFNLNILGSIQFHVIAFELNSLGDTVEKLTAHPTFSTLSNKHGSQPYRLQSKVNYWSVSTPMINSLYCFIILGKLVWFIATNAPYIILERQLVGIYSWIIEMI